MATMTKGEKVLFDNLKESVRMNQHLYKVIESMQVDDPDHNREKGRF